MTLWRTVCWNVIVMKERLIGKNLSELGEVVAAVGLPRFAASQLARWLYVSRVRAIDEMTNISLAGRAALNERYEVGVTVPSAVRTSADGTKKYLFPITGTPLRSPGHAPVSKPESKSTPEPTPTAGPESTPTPEPTPTAGPESTPTPKPESTPRPDLTAVETVMIPTEDRRTLCVSSQAGCRMGCRFCMTGRQGFHGNLTPADIISQLLAVDESAELTNAVFMGMGEPLDNLDNVLKAIEILTSDWGFGWSPKRITVSTIGTAPGLERYLSESRCHLAVSLHSPFPDERAALMPASKLFPASEIIDLIKKHDFTGQRRVSFEYIMFGGLNDDKRHADALVRMLKGLECRVNLIRFHKIPDAPFATSSEPAIDAFKTRLERGGVITTVRASRGEDILAACGMLAGKHNGGVPKLTPP